MVSRLALVSEMAKIGYGPFATTFPSQLGINVSRGVTQGFIQLPFADQD